MVPAAVLFPVVMLAVLGLAMEASAQASTRPADLPLWPRDVPGNEGRANEQRVETGQGREIVFHTYIPTIRVFLPPADKANGTGLIICPGGGYHAVEFEHEGTKLASRLNGLGVAAFVLRYRLRRYDVAGDDHAARALLDAKRAIRTVRLHAAEWRLDPSRIGIGGFSAGGHLSANAGTHFDAGDPTATDAVERMNSRPDFLMLIYPLIQTLDQDVTAQTPPAFLLHAGDDTGVLPDESIRFYQALRRNEAPAELHILQGGGHGFGMGSPGPTENWFELFRAWLANRGLLASPTAARSP
jgi:acetyl esterase/lipase